MMRHAKLGTWSLGILASLSVLQMPAAEAADGYAPIVAAHEADQEMWSAPPAYHLASHSDDQAFESMDFFEPSASTSTEWSTPPAASPACHQCQSTVCCCNCIPWWAHRNGGFGELLYLSPGSSDMIYAVEQTGPNAGASPTGPLGISNIEEELGYRVGFNWALSNKSSLIGSYTRWDGDTTDFINASGTNVLDSRLVHPSVATTGAASLSSNAYQGINFQLVDALYRKVYRAYDCGIVNWNAGLRYGNLEQTLVGQQTMSVATGLTTVTTDVDFNGFGIVSGLDAERRGRDCGFLIYGKAMGSLLAGNWQADYTQVNQFGGGVIANHYEDFRVSPVLESELGFGWQSQGGGLRVTTGYLFSAWLNTVNNRDYVQAVRTGDLLELDEALTFSGLTLRTELRF